MVGKWILEKINKKHFKRDIDIEMSYLLINENETPDDEKQTGDGSVQNSDSENEIMENLLVKL